MTRIFNPDNSISSIGSATWRTQQEFNNLFGSTGRATGGMLSQGAGVNVTVAAGTGFIKATDSDTAELLSFDWAESTNNAIPNNSVRYLGVEYNGGSPQVVMKTTDTWDLDTEFPLGSATNEGGTLHIFNNPWWVTDGMTNIIERFQSEGNVVRDAKVGGLAISVPGTRNLAITTGVVWSRLNETTVPALDTSVTGTFDIVYRDGAGAWNDSVVSQYPVLQYDNNSGTLQNMNVNWYANWWVYADAEDGEITLVYPQAQYATAASAEAATPPTDIPQHLQTHGILLGRILFRKSVDAPVSIQSAFVQQFTASLVTDHGNLAGLTDDDHTQYSLVTGTRKFTGNPAPTTGDFGFWNRASTTITPATADDIVDLTPTATNNNVPNITGSATAERTTGYGVYYGTTLRFRVYGYKVINGIKRFSPNYLDTGDFIDYSSPTYFAVLISWTDNSSNFDGYRVTIYDDSYSRNFDEYFDNATNSYTYASYSVFTSSPILSPTSYYTYSSNDYQILTDGLKTNKIIAYTEPFIELGTPFRQILGVKGIYSEAPYDETDLDGFTIPSGSGKRFLWIPSKNAFRAGEITGTEWDSANIGTGSWAGGLDCKASGEYSFAVGKWLNSTANESFTAGISNTASGTSSFCVGQNGTASNAFSFCSGLLGNASGYGSFHSGNNGTASGQYSATFGTNGTASGTGSLHFGAEGTATGAYSVHTGRGGNLTGTYSAHFGFWNLTDIFNGVTFGQWSSATGSTINSWVSTDPLIVFGNGTGSSARSNSAIFYKNGNYWVGDNSKQIQGTANDFEQYYDGTDEIYDLTISGDHYFQGGAVRGGSGFKSSDGTAGATGTITLASVTSITVKNGLITGWA